jgi:hypothetical protein
MKGDDPLEGQPRERQSTAGDQSVRARLEVPVGHAGLAVGSQAGGELGVRGRPEQVKTKIVAHDGG